MNELKEKSLFIVLSQSGTWISKLLKRITKTDYNHSSISFEENLTEMYSFGRRFKYYPFIGGFVKETPTTGVFGRFADTKVLVLKIDVSESQYGALKQRVAEMYEHKWRYHYNYIGCFLNWFHKNLERKHYLYCSEFIKELFVRYEVLDKSAFPRVIRPCDFIKIFSDCETYRGNFIDYCYC